MQRTFSAYVNKITKNIFYIPARIRVREELLDHMIQKRKELCKIYTWEEATSIVIKEMGDEKELSNSFNMVYSPVKHYISFGLSILIFGLSLYFVGFLGNQYLKSFATPRYQTEVLELIEIDDIYYVDDTTLKFSYVIKKENQTIIFYRVSDDRLFNITSYDIFSPGTYPFLDVVTVQVGDETLINKMDIRDTTGFFSRPDERNVYYTQYEIIIPRECDEVIIHFEKNDRNLEVPLKWTTEK